MNHSDVIRSARTDGVSLYLAPDGGLEVDGEARVVDRWLPILRDHKTEILEALTAEGAQQAKPPTRGFLLEPGGDQARLFDEAFDRVSREVQRQYVRGTCYLVSDHHPELFKKTETARKQVVRLWELGRNGGGDLAAFKAALDEWKELRGEWADAAKGHGGGDT